MGDTSRRSFLKTAGAAIATGAWITGSPTAAEGRKLRHALIGVGGQGRAHLKNLVKMDSMVEIAALCDIDPEQLNKVLPLFGKDSKVKPYADFREMLKDPTIDSVTVATPDHWHAPAALAAIQAGKHVYVEKPCAHNIKEALALADAARKHNKCVQHGTQSRSGHGIRDAIQRMRDGLIGTVRMAKAINHQFRPLIGSASEEAPPEGVNYDLWLGPAPLRPFTKNRWHYNWHWHWDYGTGDIGNDGIHQLDVARWGLGVEIPHTITAAGGQLFYRDDHETPDTQVVTYEFKDVYLMYEMRLWTDYPLEGHDNGVVFYGDKGKLEVGRQGCVVALIGKEPEKIGEGSDFNANIRNFFECIQKEDPSGLNAPISEGAISALLCHFGNIGVRTGRKLHFDAASMSFVGDAEADALMSRSYRKGYELPTL